MAALGLAEMHLLVNRYIGVHGGYLGDFSYRSHAEFYLDLGLDIDPNLYPGTTRERFRAIINESPPDVQARIIRGILTKYPMGSDEGRTQQAYDDLMRLANALDGQAPPRARVPQPEAPSASVTRALRDAEALITTTGAVSAVDRVHTALHGYLRMLCTEAAILYEETDTAQRLMTLLSQGHPALEDPGPHADGTRRILRSLASAVETLGTHRNRGSNAHDNEQVLEDAEAVLAINAAYAVVTYLEMRLRHR